MYSSLTGKMLSYSWGHSQMSNITNTVTNTYLCVVYLFLTQDLTMQTEVVLKVTILLPPSLKCEGCMHMSHHLACFWILFDTTGGD